MDADTAARYARQMLLPGFGRQGQLRLAAAAAAVAGEQGLEHRVATRYARRAGFGRLAPGDIDTDALAPKELVQLPQARAILAGSRAVSRAMVEVVLRGGERG